MGYKDFKVLKGLQKGTDYLTAAFQILKISGALPQGSLHSKSHCMVCSRFDENTQLSIMLDPQGT